MPALLAVGALALWAAVVALRIGYPFELEWMEGGMLDHIQRLRSGEALYSAPSLEFAAFPYTPAFHALAVPAVALFGEGFLGPRLISVLATLGVMVLLARIAVRIEGRSGATEHTWVAGLFAAGLFAAGYGFTGAWYDIARVDSLAACCALAGLALALGRGSRGALVGAAVCGVLACLTKQTYVALALAAGCVVARQHGLRSAALYASVFVLLLAGAVISLDRASDGWFLFTTFELLRGAPQHGPLVAGFWRECALALGLAWFAVALAIARGRMAAPDSGWWAVVGACFAAGWLGRAHEGGFENNLIPPLLATALWFGPAAARLLSRPSLSLWLVPTGALLALTYDPRALIPTPEDRAAGERLVARIAELEPPVLLPDHGYLLRRAFGPTARPGVHGMAINDLLKSRSADEARALVEALTKALQSRRYSAVILDERWDDDLPALAEHYHPPSALWAPDDAAFVPVTGAPKRPTWLYLRR